MTSRTKNILGLVLFAAASVVVFFLVRRTQRARLRAIDSVPADAFFVLVADADLLRKSPLAEPFLGGPSSKLLGGKTIAESCGFDPMDRLHEVAVAVPVEDETGELGVALRADVTQDELAGCAKKVLESRGVADKVTTEQRGSFTWVVPEGDLARKYPTLAFREGGPYLVARGPWLETMVDTTEGKLPSARRASKHLALRRELGQKDDNDPAFALLATVILPKEMRERVRKDMGSELAQAGESASPALMAGVLGVEAAGLGVVAGTAAGDQTRVLLLLSCEDEPACAAVGRLVEKKKKEWSEDLSVRILGVGPLLDNVTVENHGKSLRLSTHAAAEDVAKWVERVLELRGGRHPTGRGLDLDAGPAGGDAAGEASPAKD